MIENENFYSEAVVHTALCVHPDPKKVLVLNAKEGFENEIKKHEDTKAVLVQGDSLSEIAKVENASFDVIFLVSDFDKEKDEFSVQFYAQVSRCLKDDGIFVTESVNPFLDIELKKEAIGNLSSFFSVTMPFRCDAPGSKEGFKYFNFASKKYHPTADIILQKADLIDDLTYYGAEVHIASFTLAKGVEKELTGIMKR